MLSYNSQSLPAFRPHRTIITRIRRLPFGPSSTIQKATFMHQDTRTPRTRIISSTIKERETTPPKPTKIQWVKGELIGKGSYAKVYLGLNATTGELMAVKQVELPQTPSDRLSPRHIDITKALRFEGETLKGLDHPNIVRYLGFDESRRYLSIFLEYVPGGTISSCLQKHGRFSEEVTKSFTHQMLKGLEYLHRKGIIHRDLKSDNILVEPSGVCKISDFGISKQAEDVQGRAYTGMRGTIYWMAPEILENDKERGYDYKVDIWSVGCIVLEMWTGERPWYPEEVFPVMIKLSQQKLAPPIPPNLVLSQDASDFRRQCFQKDPRNRPSAAELQEHPYLLLPAGWKFETSEIEEYPLRRNFSQLSRRSGRSHRTYRHPQTSLRGDPEVTSPTVPVPLAVANSPSSRSPKGFDTLTSRVHRQQDPPHSSADDGPPVVYIMPRGSQSTRRAPSPNNSSRTSLDTSGSVSTPRKGFRIINPDPEPEHNTPFVYQPPPLPACDADSPYSAHLVPPVIPTIDESYPPHLRSNQPSTSSESLTPGNFLTERAASRYPNQNPSVLTRSSACSESGSEDDNDLWAKRPTDLGVKRAVPRRHERSLSRNHRISSRAPSHLSGHDEWARPAAAEVYENLQEFFPECELNKSVSVADLPRAKQGDGKNKRKTKSIRMVAEEWNICTQQKRTEL